MAAATAGVSPCRKRFAAFPPNRLTAGGVCVRCARRRVRPAPPPPPWPTEHLPGTDGKLIIMGWRAQNGLALWHPDDARGPAPVEASEPRRTRSARAPRVYRAAVAG